MEYAWLNGEVLPVGEARIPITDPGFLLGDGCFETVRIHRGSPFRLAQHLRRLEESHRLLGLPSTVPTDALRSGTRALVERTHLAEGLIRITLTASDKEKSSPGTTLITVRPLPDIPGTVTLHVCESVRRVPGPLSVCKTTSRALEAAALREARQLGDFDAILLNPSDRLVETTARNLFLVFGDTLRTPPLSEGALPGITREAVLALAPELDLEVDEVPLPRAEMARAREMFLTGSGVGVLAVAAVGDRRFGATPGPRTSRVSRAYEELLDRDSRW